MKTLPSTRDWTTRTADESYCLVALADEWTQEGLSGFLTEWADGKEHVTRLLADLRKSYDADEDDVVIQLELLRSSLAALLEGAELGKPVASGRTRAVLDAVLPLLQQIVDENTEEGDDG